jgi:hypothetical protein
MNGVIDVLKLTTIICWSLAQLLLLMLLPSALRPFPMRWSDLISQLHPYPSQSPCSYTAGAHDLHTFLSDRKIKEISSLRLPNSLRIVHIYSTKLSMSSTSRKA